ncbi:hypothetical protein BO83DRAFT_449085 [Aspergillus eucalypticola CBS 122712]|uniref:Uncharacterized protein n=1 Tax=Aspergillus eucalypticola (strain CBS 122712 / IBT 29274) TaxID=1448314 RepID=A0A317V7R9_ASPEC|nr:uncharacterized protein BO83DRAFT_449085 [Aspergillus eucalypticola CBS 122712]PWY68892.1 hypothetical protein BO83DRAFT_449085 [Aspergillus eucalypticola CBS 122712]
MQKAIGKVSEIDNADETYEHIHKAVLDEAPRKRKGVASKLHNMRRIYYASVSQYIEDFMKTCDLAHRLGCGYEPYFAALVLLINLRSDMPEWCDIIDQQLEGYDNLNYAADHFHDLCKEALEKAETADVSALSETSSRNRRKQVSNKKKAA